MYTLLTPPVPVCPCACMHQAIPSADCEIFLVTNGGSGSFATASEESSLHGRVVRMTDDDERVDFSAPVDKDLLPAR